MKNNTHNQITIVEAKANRRGVVEYTPYRIELAYGQMNVYPLVRVNHDGPAVSFPTFQEAERYRNAFENGSNEDGIAASHWDDVAGEWVADEFEPRTRRRDREDFHADG